MSELPALNTDTIWGILNDQINDATVVQLVWYYLGYRYDSATEKWDNSAVAPEWRDEYPEPPSFLESRPATMKLTRSIPTQYKQITKEKLGFKGYKLGTFTPRETRRATAANWLLSYLQQKIDRGE